MEQKMMQQNQKVLQENQTVQLEQNQCLLADFEQMDLLDLHLLAALAAILTGRGSVLRCAVHWPHQ